MFDTIDEFVRVWADESATTRRVLQELSDETVVYRPHSSVRSLGELAWHVVTAIREIAGLTGLPLTGPDKSMAAPERAGPIQAAYQSAAHELARLVRARWSADDLDQIDAVYGEAWPRRQTLDTLVRHEIHHRGQIALMLRLAGSRVPSIYGPSRDEWEPGRPR